MGGKASGQVGWVMVEWMGGEQGWGRRDRRDIY